MRDDHETPRASSNASSHTRRARGRPARTRSRSPSLPCPLKVTHPSLAVLDGLCSSSTISEAWCRRGRATSGAPHRLRPLPLLLRIVLAAVLAGARFLVELLGELGEELFRQMPHRLPRVVSRRPALPPDEAPGFWCRIVVAVSRPCSSTDAAPTVMLARIEASATPQELAVLSQPGGTPDMPAPARQLQRRNEGRVVLARLARWSAAYSLAQGEYGIN